MLQNLTDTNPRKRWLGESFKVKLDLIGGRSIVINFDMHTDADMFDTERVIKEFGDSILADIEKEYGEFLSVASTIATVLNNKMQIIADEVVRHYSTSDRILQALEHEDYYNAAQLLDELVVSLIIFEPQASAIWTEWVYKVYTFIDTQNSLGFFGM